MASIIKVDTIQDQDGNNIISEAANTITIGASGDTITIPSGATLANSGIVTGFQSTGIDDNATSTAITIDSSQRVGIGTASPAVKFQVGQTGDSGHLVNIGVDNSNTELRIANRAFYGYYSDGAVIQGSTGKHISFHTDSTTFGANERMRIDSSGKVGIGTSTMGGAPGSMLTLDGSGASYTQYNRGTNGGGAVGTEGNGLVFYTYSGSLGSETYTKHLTINSSGNVGIGTTSPSTKLHINQGGEPPAEGMLILQANSTSRQLRIQPPTDADNGFIDYKGGNLTFLDDGVEIARFQGTTGFEVTGTIKVSNGIYLGGTVAANLLDDYEEGTFTTTLTPSTSGTITIASNQDTLKYIKIGNTVFIQGRLTISTISAPVGVSVILGNMPFTPTSAVETSGWFGGMCAISFNGSSTFEPYTVWTTDGVVKITTTTSSINSNTRIHFNFFYETA
jgi:hypothetical protein